MMAYILVKNYLTGEFVFPITLEKKNETLSGSSRYL